MNNDTITAKKILIENGYTCVFYKNGLEYHSDQRGVKPLIAFLDSGVNFKGFCAADKVIGAGAAHLYVLLGVKELWANVISEQAKEILKRNNILVSYDSLVPSIINRYGDGVCPIEKAVIGIDSSVQALEVIKNKLAQLNVKTVKRDFHMHPNLLKIPSQADLFIDKAIELGFEEICFTDHMPFSVTGDEHDRIPAGQVGLYCEKVKEKAEQYKDRIKIKTGIEIDYYPECTKEIEKVLSEGTFDYVIGSSHLNIKGFNIPIDKTTKTKFARLVLENYLKAALSGYFDTISHLDVYRWVFSEYPLIEDNYTYLSNVDIIESIFEVLEKTGVMLEINAAPLYKKFDNLGAYPENEILKLSKKFKIKYIYGSDAHTYDKVGYGYDELQNRGE